MRALTRAPQGIQNWVAWETVAMKRCYAVGLGMVCLYHAAQGALYNGNGSKASGGSVGLGSLNLTDNGTTISAAFNKGGSAGTGFNDVLVIFIDSKSGGFTDTSSFSDNGNGLTRAISGFSSGGSRSTAVFASGFAADYAIALSFDSGINLYRLASGGGGSLEALGPLSFSPHDSKTQPTFTFTFTWANINPEAGNSFRFESSYITETGFRSLESFESLTGTAGFGNTITFGNYDSYPIAPIPETTNASLAIFGMMVLCAGGFRCARRYYKKLNREKTSQEI